MVPKGSSSDGVKNVEENGPRSQKYVHRSIVAEGLENESLARRYVPHKLGSNGVNWYRRKAAHEGRRGFGISTLGVMGDEELEDDVLPPEPDSKISDSLIPEESTDESATSKRGVHVDKIPPGVEILGERNLIEIEKSETNPANLEAQTRQKKGKKKKRPHKKRPKPTVPPSSNARGLETRVGDEENDLVSDSLGENVNDVTIGKEDNVNEVKSSVKRSKRPRESSVGGSKRQEYNVDVVDAMPKEKPDDEGDEEEENVVKQQGESKQSGVNKFSVRDFTRDEEVLRSEEDDGDQSFAFLEETPDNQQERAFSRNKLSSRGSSVRRSSFRSPRERLSTRYTRGREDPAGRYQGRAISQKEIGNGLRLVDEGVDSSQDDAAMAKIVQQILGLERAYGERYTNRDFGQVKTPVRIRARPADSEPIYLV